MRACDDRYPGPRGLGGKHVCAIRTSLGQPEQQFYGLHGPSRITLPSAVTRLYTAWTKSQTDKRVLPQIETCCRTMCYRSRESGCPTNFDVCRYRRWARMSRPPSMYLEPLGDCACAPARRPGPESAQSAQRQLPRKSSLSNKHMCFSCYSTYGGLWYDLQALGSPHSMACFTDQPILQVQRRDLWHLKLGHESRRASHAERKRSVPPQPFPPSSLGRPGRDLPRPLCRQVKQRYFR